MMLIQVIVLTIALLLVQELFRRGAPWLSWMAFAVVPVVLIPHWVWHTPEFGWFPWVKLGSIQFSACWVTLLRFTSFSSHRIAVVAMMAILGINIVEAVVQDLDGGHVAHWLVALSGVLTLVALPHPARAIEVDSTGQWRDLLYNGLNRGWILEYTVWNWAFVFLNFPQIAGHHLGVLLAALLVGLADPRRWLQARVYTLAVDLLLLATWPQPLQRWLDTTAWSTPARENIAALICLTVATIAALRMFFRLGRGRQVVQHGTAQ